MNEDKTERFCLMKEVETVKEHCKHEDCIYRRYLCWTPYCDYIGVEKQPRGCDISKCDKYKAGKKVQPRMHKNYELDWEWESFGLESYCYERQDDDY